MSLYRCAACGSPNVVIDTENGNVDYNFVKGAVGTILLGAGGATAGVQSKKERVFKCPECGLTLKEPMGFELKTLIDMGVMSTDARKNLKLNGVQIDWEVLTKRYKNIEKDSFDVNTETTPSTAHAVAQSVPVQTPSNRTATDTADGKQLYDSAYTQYAEECELWRIECERIEDARLVKIEEELTAERLKRERKFEKEKEAAVAKHTQKRDVYIRQKESAETKLQSLELFKFVEKIATKKEIENLMASIKSENSLISYALLTYEQKMEELAQNKSELRDFVRASVAKKLPLPKKPSKPNGIIRYNSNGAETSAYDLVVFSMQEEIFRFVEANGSATYNQIKKGCSCLSDLTDQRIKEFIQGLLDNDELRSWNGKYYVKYGKSKAKEQAERAEQRESTLKNPENRAIYELLKKHSDKRFTLSEVLESANLPNGVSHLRISTCLRHLIAAGLVEHIEVSQKTYFKFAK